MNDIKITFDGTKCNVNAYASVEQLELAKKAIDKLIEFKKANPPGSHKIFYSKHDKAIG
jgi:hypothetical protein